MLTFAILILIPALALSQPDHDALEHKIFNGLDADHDGKITELENEAYFLAFDTNHDTEVTKAEFTAAVDKVDPALVGHEDLLFGLLDHDSDGQVDKSDIDAAFTKSDANGDGHIDHLEFHVTFQVVIGHVG